ncbi:MAG: iron ABC transporter permease [Acidobacteriota bacterium]
MRKSQPFSWALYAFVLLVLLWLVLYPNVFVLLQSVQVEGSLSLQHYRSFFQSQSQFESLRNSVVISLGSVLLSALIGVPLALLFHRYDFPGKRVFGALVSLPVLLPPLVGVIAFMFLYGESGIVTRLLQGLLALDRPPFSLRGPWAILFVHAYTMYVYFYLFAGAGLRRLDVSLLDAARSLGASRVRVFLTVTLPLLTPALVGASLLTFMTSMASFSAPYLFGGGFRVLALQIYNSKLNGDIGMALVETVILSLTSILFLIFLRRYEGTQRYRSLTKGATRPLKTVEGRWSRLGAGLTGVIVTLFLLLPHLTLVLISFAQDGTWTTEILPPQYTWDNYHRIFSDAHSLEPILNSLQMAALATAANFLFAFLAAYLLTRRAVRARTLISALVALPWALPGTVLALNLITTFNQHRPWQGRYLLVGTFWILPLAYFIRHIPVVTRAVQASFEQFDPALEEAGRSLGGRWLYVMRRVVLPMVVPGALAGSLLAFVTALGEFVTSIVIYTVHNRPISIEILAQLRQFNFGTAAAYGVLLVLLIASVFLASEKYTSQSEVQI